MGKCEAEFGIKFDTSYAEQLREELLEMRDDELSELFGSSETSEVSLVAFAQVSDGEVIDFGFEWGTGMGHELGFGLGRYQIATMSGNEFFERVDRHLYECIFAFLNIAEEEW